MRVELRAKSRLLLLSSSCRDTDVRINEINLLKDSSEICATNKQNPTEIFLSAACFVLSRSFPSFLGVSLLFNLASLNFKENARMRGSEGAVVQKSILTTSSYGKCEQK